MTEQFANAATTTLNGLLSAVATDVFVASVNSFPGSGTFRIIVGSEIMLVTGVYISPSPKFEVTRGAEGTTAGSHSSGAAVTCIVTAGAITQLSTDIVATASATVLPIDLAADVTGTLPIANGGTGSTNVGLNGAALYANGSGNVAGSAVVTIEEASQELRVVTAAQPTVIRIRNYAGASTNGANLVAEKARGTLASPTKVLSGDQLGGFGGRGWYEDGTPAFGPSTANSLRYVAEEDFTSTTNGTAFVAMLCRPGSTSVGERYRVSGTGKVTISPSGMSSGSWGLLSATAVTHTNQTASTELNDVLFDCTSSLQFATGAITTQRQFLITPRTYRFVAASVITNAATFAISGAPIAGTNATITNTFAFWVQAGTARFDGGISASSFGGAAVIPVANGGTNQAALISAMGALAIDWSLAPSFTKTLSAGSNTITFSNQVAGMTIVVRLTSNGGGSTVTWPTVKWPGGAAPTQTSTGRDVYTFFYDGTDTYGSAVQAMA